MNKLPAPDRREQIVQRLSTLFATGKIELEELEQRMDVAMRATTPQALEAALEGLVAERAPAHAPGTAVAPASGEFSIDRPRRRGAAVTIAVMSGTDRKGRWAPARHHVGVAVMGGALLDFRDAVLGPGVTTHVWLGAWWGGIEVAVPEDLDVEVSGLAIMGGLERVAQESGSTDPRRPRLHIHALAIMGGIEVKTLKPGEPYEPEKDSDEPGG